MSSSELGLHGRTAIVTGAGGNPNPGRSQALLNVIVNNIGSDPETPGYQCVAPGEAIAHEIPSLGGRAIADTQSMVSPERVAAILAAAIDAFGRIDSFVNNAGISIAAPFEVRYAISNAKKT